MISLATRDPRLLFEAVSRLDREKLIDPDQFRIQWYVDAGSKAIIMQAATAYPVARYMDFFDYVPASEIPGVLNHSSILLQLANTFASNGPKGFMTTKLFESMAVEKPLLCVKSDESYLEETIRITRSGLAARTTEDVYKRQVRSRSVHEGTERTRSALARTVQYRSRTVNNGQLRIDKMCIRDRQNSYQRGNA